MDMPTRFLGLLCLSNQGLLSARTAGKSKFSNPKVIYGSEEWYLHTNQHRAVVQLRDWSHWLNGTAEFGAERL